MTLRAKPSTDGFWPGRCSMLTKMFKAQPPARPLNPRRRTPRWTNQHHHPTRLSAGRMTTFHRGRSLPLTVSVAHEERDMPARGAAAPPACSVSLLSPAVRGALCAACVCRNTSTRLPYAHGVTLHGPVSTHFVHSCVCLAWIVEPLTPSNSPFMVGIGNCRSPHPTRPATEGPCRPGDSSCIDWASPPIWPISSEATVMRSTVPLSSDGLSQSG